MNLNDIAGFSLIEVLISLLLLSMIVLGFDAAEVYSVRAIRAAYYFNVANHQLNNMIERLEVTKEVGASEEQIEVWNRQNQTVLPQGAGQVSGYFPAYKIAVYWGGMMASCQQNQWGNSGCMVQDIVI